MGSITRVESCHDLPVQDSGGGVQFCEFVANMLVLGSYMRNKIGLHPFGPLLEGGWGSWPIYGKVVWTVKLGTY